MDTLIALTDKYFDGKTTPVYSGNISYDQGEYQKLYQSQSHVDAWFEEEKTKSEQFIRPCRSEPSSHLYGTPSTDASFSRPSFPFNYFQPKLSPETEQQVSQQVSHLLLGLYAKAWNKVDKLEFGSKNWISSLWNSSSQEFTYRFDLKKLGLNEKNNYDNRDIAIIALLVYAKFCLENDSLNHEDLLKVLLKIISWLASSLNQYPSQKWMSSSGNGILPH